MKRHRLLTYPLKEDSDTQFPQLCTVQCRYNAVYFSKLLTTDNPAARLQHRETGYILWVQILI